MEKMRCSSCGGEITIDNDKEYGKCPYCGTKYKLKNDINFNIKLDDNIKDVLNNSTNRFSKFLLIPILSVSIIIFTIIIILVLRFNSQYKSVNINKNNNSIYNSLVDNITKKSFNSQFLGANGTKNDFFLRHTLDDIIESNKTHERKVILEFENKEITDEKEIIEIKHSLSGNYEVSFNYDEEGFINKIIVEKIE